MHIYTYVFTICIFGGQRSSHRGIAISPLGAARRSVGSTQIPLRWAFKVYCAAVFASRHGEIAPGPGLKAR